MERLCFLNDLFVPLADAKVSVEDIGILRGFGVYEALRSYGAEPFKLVEHLARFRRAAAAMGVTVPLMDAEIESAIRALIVQNIPKNHDAVIRIILTGGRAAHGIEFNPSTPTFYILCEQLEPVPEEMLRRGARLIMHEHLRLFAESKTTNYAEAVSLQRERLQARALDVLYTWQGKVLECATSNFFIVKNNVVITAKNDILLGTTRAIVLDIAKNSRTVEERDVSVEQLYAADEAFLTASFKGVVPVVDVGARTIASGAPGPVTLRMMELFEEYVRTAR